MLQKYFALFFLVMAMIPAAASADDGPSYPLVQSLATLQGLSESDFMMVSQWAANPSQPNSAFLPWQGAESQIWSLGKRDRDSAYPA